jgi:hypothetical protein
VHNKKKSLLIKLIMTLQWPFWPHSTTTAGDLSTAIWGPGTKGSSLATSLVVGVMVWVELQRVLGSYWPQEVISFDKSVIISGKRHQLGEFGDPTNARQSATYTTPSKA